MNIIEAIKKTNEFTPYITRINQCWGSGDGRLKAQPTDTYGFILKAPGELPCPRWQPDREDILADDWDVCD